MRSLTPTLDALCLAARDTPVYGVEGIHSVWVGGTALRLPDEWIAHDRSASRIVAAVAEAWRLFWTRPFRAFSNRDGRHLVIWQAARLQLHPSLPTGMRLHRASVSGHAVMLDITQDPHSLCLGMTGAKTRALMEAGLHACLRGTLRRHGLPADVPRPFLEVLGERVEWQFDARLDWRVVAAELSALLLDGLPLATLFDGCTTTRRRYPLWRRAALAMSATAQHWPDTERAFLPFAVVMAQHRVPPRGPEDVAHWLHAQGLSRRSVSRLHCLAPEVAGELAGLMLDLRLPALRCVLDAANRYLAALAACPPESLRTDVAIDALAWLALDAGQSMHSLTPGGQRHTAPGLAPPPQDVLPWPESGRAEYAIERGFRPVPEHLAPRRQPDMDREERYQRQFARHVSIRAEGRRGNLTVTDLLHGRTPDDTRAIRHFATRMTRMYLAGEHRRPRVGNVIGDTCDWLRHARPLPGLAQLRGDWDDLQRRQRLWHAQQHERTQKPPEATPPWPARIGTVASPPWRAVELNSRLALWHEGNRLQHCVHSYAAQCERGDSVIFSLRMDDGDEPHATAEFRRGERGWELVQLRGLANADFPREDTPAREAVEDLLRLVARRLDAAQDHAGARRAG